MSPPRSTRRGGCWPPPCSTRPPRLQRARRLAAVMGRGVACGRGGHRILRCGPRPAPRRGRRRGRRGEPPEPPDATAPRQDRHRRRRGRGASRAQRRGCRCAQVRRRLRGGDPHPQRGSPLRRQGPHRCRQPDQRCRGDRPRTGQRPPERTQHATDDQDLCPVAHRRRRRSRRRRSRRRRGQTSNAGTGSPPSGPSLAGVLRLGRSEGARRLGVSTTSAVWGAAGLVR